MLATQQYAIAQPGGMHQLGLLEVHYAHRPRIFDFLSSIGIICRMCASLPASILIIALGNDRLLQYGFACILTVCMSSVEWLCCNLYPMGCIVCDMFVVADT